MRIGQGIDVHRFSNDPDRILVLGGVVVPGTPGLEGHSDADVATHALCDALLGAAGLGDLGTFFPDSDPALAGADSLELLARVLGLLEERGWAPVNADLTIVAQRPRIGPYREAMATTLSQRAGCPVSVKATTTEGLGPIGAGDGIAASAVVLIAERT